MIDTVDRRSVPRHRARAARLVALSLTLTAASAAAAAAATPPVGLGTAGAYAVLAGSGMTNTGVSTITGDIGSSPTHSQTGFAPCPAADCVALTGTDHDVADPNDAQTQQAKVDLTTAYGDAFGRTGGTPVVGPLGLGATLVPGVYTSATDIFVGGDLTLDGGGDPDAVFIFQARTGTLITAAGTTSGIPNTRVLLQNGAQACNVFWQVGSSATISTGTQFVGTILASASITVNTGATLEPGRALARNAAVTLDTNVIRAAGCATPLTPGTPTSGGTPTTGGTSTTGGTPTTGGTTSGGTSAPRATPRGVARLSTPAGAVHGPFLATVTGRSVASVRFYVDGRRVATVEAKRGRTRFSHRIAVGRDGRVHRLTVRIRFTGPGGGGTTTVHRTFRRIQRRTGPPRFAG